VFFFLFVVDTSNCTWLFLCLFELFLVKMYLVMRDEFNLLRYLSKHIFILININIDIIIIIIWIEIIINFTFQTSYTLSEIESKMCYFARCCNPSTFNCATVIFPLEYTSCGNRKVSSTSQYSFYLFYIISNILYYLFEYFHDPLSLC
jgi:hypothetical protein